MRFPATHNRAGPATAIGHAEYRRDARPAHNHGAHNGSALSRLFGRGRKLPRVERQNRGRRWRSGSNGGSRALADRGSPGPHLGRGPVPGLGPLNHAIASKTDFQFLRNQYRIGPKLTGAAARGPSGGSPISCNGPLAHSASRARFREKNARGQNPSLHRPAPTGEGSRFLNPCRCWTI
jgi:hypothetical protein